MTKRTIAVVAGMAVLATVAMVAVTKAETGGPNVLVAKLSGANEIDAEGNRDAGDPDGMGRARITMFPKARRVCFNLRWSKIGAPTMAHIHRGTRGVNGGIEVVLFMEDPPQPLPAQITGVRGCERNVPRPLIREIKQRPRQFYVNVHNEEFPGGAIRGQLRQ